MTYFEKGYYPLVTVSGGTGAEGVPEGTAMKSYLVSEGIPAGSIIVDNDGVDTKSSAVNSSKIMRSHKMKSIFVISQYFHIPRSKLALKKQGVDEIYSAAPDFLEGRDIYSVMREVPAYLKYLVSPRGDEETVYPKSH